MDPPHPAEEEAVDDGGLRFDFVDDANAPGDISVVGFDIRPTIQAFSVPYGLSDDSDFKHALVEEVYRIVQLEDGRFCDKEGNLLRKPEALIKLHEALNERATTGNQ